MRIHALLLVVHSSDKLELLSCIARRDGTVHSRRSVPSDRVTGSSYGRVEGAGVVGQSSNRGGGGARLDEAGEGGRGEAVADCVGWGRGKGRAGDEVGTGSDAAMDARCQMSMREVERERGGRTQRKSRQQHQRWWT